VVELPDWGPARRWRLLADTSKPSPLDFIAVDDHLSESEAATALEQAAAWTDANTYALLPWSCIVLESVARPQSATEPRNASAHLGAELGATHDELLATLMQ